jgi:uncharacterized protein DUF4136
MTVNLRNLWIYLLILASSIMAFAQKVKVGYDKGADFSKYTTYTWVEPSPPPSRPLLYLSIVGSVDYELKAKGLTRVEKDADLLLMPAGGMEYGMNVAASTPVSPTYGGPPPAIDSTMWTGAGGFSNLMAPYVPEGTLALTFVDRAANKVIWTGTVSEKLDMENKKKSLEVIDKSIVKLLKQFPPKKK